MLEEDNLEENGNKVCPQCNAGRTVDDLVPDWQCPECQIVYHKYRTPEEQQQIDLAAAAARKSAQPKPPSPWPWLLLIFASLIACIFFSVNYFRRPDSDKITLFTANECGPACDLAREWLSRKQVSFSELNVDTDKANFNLWRNSRGRGYPLAFFGPSRVDGFSDATYDIALTAYQDQLDGVLNQAVIIYTREGCSDCASAIEFFDKYKIEFEEYDIKEAENYQVYRELFGRGTPLIFIGNIRFDGFDEKLAKRALTEIDLL